MSKSCVVSALLALLIACFVTACATQSGTLMEETSDYHLQLAGGH